MKTSTLFLKNILCFVIGIMTVSLSAQTIITIDNNPGSTTTHQTLQAALDDIETNSIADAVIYVQPSGNSYGNGVIDSPVTIVGRSHSEPGKKSIVGRINPRSSNITLKGLEISQLYYSGGTGTPDPPYSNLSIFECEINSTFYLGSTTSQTAATHIDGVIVRGCVIQSILVYADTADVLLSNNIFSSGNPLSTYNAATTVVTNNIFRYWSTQITLDNHAPSQTLLLFNNMFIITYLPNVDVTINFRYGNFNLTNNLTYKYNGSNVNFDVSSNGSYLDSFTLANTDPLFTNVDTSISQSFADNSSYNPTNRLDDDLTLQDISPALTGGGGGSEIGLYNNGFNYNILGNPNGVPTIDVLSYDGAVEIGGNINVTINAKAN